jgi:hypothetical protein
MSEVRALKAIGGRKGNIVVSARAARRAQELVLLIEERGLHPERARICLGVSERTSRRYRAAWGEKSRDLRRPL